jgi:ParB-like chromosome segregation protein Spo0J
MVGKFRLDHLVHADFNPRIMPKEEMESLKESIKTWGFVEPVVVNIHKDRYGILVGGHQRITALRQLIKEGITPKGIDITSEGIFEVPASIVEFTLEQEKHLNIALNKIMGKWDDDKLFTLIDSIKDSSFLPATGFDSSEISSILSRGEDAPAAPETKHVCNRCVELKKQVEGHEHRSGHKIHEIKDPA